MPSSEALMINIDCLRLHKTTATAAPNAGVTWSGSLLVRVPWLESNSHGVEDFSNKETVRDVSSG